MLLVGAATAHATDYGIYVFGTQITSNNLSYSVGGGTVRYDVDNNILYISGVSYGTSNSAIEVRKNSNRTDNDLYIRFSGSNQMRSNTDALVCRAKTSFFVDNGTTQVMAGKSGKNAIAIYNVPVLLKGAGKMELQATGNVVEGHDSYSNASLTFQIKECVVGLPNYGEKRLTRLNSVGIYPTSYSSEEGAYVTSTKITLTKTSNSNYKPVDNVNSWTNDGAVVFQTPTDTYFDASNQALANSSYSLFSYSVVISDEKNNPSYTIEGNYIYQKKADGGVNYAFLMGPTLSYRNSNPTSLVVPGYATIEGTTLQAYLAQDAFSGMEWVQSVTLCYGVAGIAYGAMRYMPALNFIKIPSSVKSIGNYAFKGSCGSAGSFTVYWSTLDAEAVSVAGTAFNDIDLSKEKRVVYVPTKHIREQASGMSPFSVVTINAYARPDLVHDFAYYENAYVVNDPVNCKVSLVGSSESVVPSTVRISQNNGTFTATADYGGKTWLCDRVAQSAFSDCQTITTFDASYPALRAIEGMAFANCTNLSTIMLNDNITHLGANAFGRTAVTTISIPQSLKTIEYSFWGCSNLKTVEWNAKNCDDIPTSLAGPFENCPNISTLNLGTMVETIPGSLCRGGFGAMTSVTIPSTVTSIRQYAFVNCSGLEAIYPQMMEPQEVSYPSPTTIFDGVNKEVCKIIVPQGTLAKYKSTIPWSYFLNIEQEGGGTPGDVNGDGKVNVSDVTALINMIMGLTTMDESVADVNGDGRVNVSDVSALINIILGIS